MAQVKIARTSAGLREALFDAMEAVRSGDLEPNEAKQIAGLAREIINTVKMDLEVQKVRDTYLVPASTIPDALQLGIVEKPKDEDGEEADDDPVLPVPEPV